MVFFTSLHSNIGIESEEDRRGRSNTVENGRKPARLDMCEGWNGVRMGMRRERSERCRRFMWDITSLAVQYDWLMIYLWVKERARTPSGADKPCNVLLVRKESFC